MQSKEPTKAKLLSSRLMLYKFLYNNLKRLFDPAFAGRQVLGKIIFIKKSSLSFQQKK
jgi:hypothetical protein